MPITKEIKSTLFLVFNFKRIIWNEKTCLSVCLYLQFLKQNKLEHECKIEKGFKFIQTNNINFFGQFDDSNYAIIWRRKNWTEI